MKPENELKADQVAFVNTCEKYVERIHELEAGGLLFELNIYGEDGALVEEWGNLPKLRDIDAEDLGAKVAAATSHDGILEPLSLREFDKLLETGTAPLPSFSAPTVTDGGTFSNVLTPKSAEATLADALGAIGHPGAGAPMNLSDGTFVNSQVTMADLERSKKNPKPKGK